MQLEDEMKPRMTVLPSYSRNCVREVENMTDLYCCNRNRGCVIVVDGGQQTTMVFLLEARSLRNEYVNTRIQFPHMGSVLQLDVHEGWTCSIAAS